MPSHADLVRQSSSLDRRSDETASPEPKPHTKKHETRISVRLSSTVEGQPLRKRTEKRSDDFCRKHGNLHDTAPEGFAQILDKMIRAVLIARPLRLREFFAEFLEAEIGNETLCRLQYARQQRIKSEDYELGLYRCTICKHRGGPATNHRFMILQNTHKIYEIYSHYLKNLPPATFWIPAPLNTIKTLLESTMDSSGRNTKYRDSLTCICNRPLSPKASSDQPDDYKDHESPYPRDDATGDPNTAAGIEFPPERSISQIRNELTDLAANYQSLLDRDKFGVSHFMESLAEMPNIRAQPSAMEDYLNNLQKIPFSVEDGVVPMFDKEIVFGDPGYFAAEGEFEIAEPLDAGDDDSFYDDTEPAQKVFSDTILASTCCPSKSTERVFTGDFDRPSSSTPYFLTGSVLDMSDGPDASHEEHKLRTENEENQRKSLAAEAAREEQRRKSEELEEIARARESTLSKSSHLDHIVEADETVAAAEAAEHQSGVDADQSESDTSMSSAETGSSASSNTDRSDLSDVVIKTESDVLQTDLKSGGNSVEDHATRAEGKQFTMVTDTIPVHDPRLDDEEPAVNDS